MLDWFVFLDNRVVEYAKNLKLSACGELEITNRNIIYLEPRLLNVELDGRGFTWDLILELMKALWMP